MRDAWASARTPTCLRTSPQRRSLETPTRTTASRTCSESAVYQPLSRCSCSRASTRTRASTATQPVGAGDDRVQVELGDLGQVVREPAEPEEQVDERARVGGRRAAEAARRAGRPSRSCTSSSASTSVSGASRKPASPISSASTPPGPNATSGPKTGSWTTPASSSAPPVEERLHDHRRADPLDRRRAPALVAEVERDAADLGLVDARPPPS